MRNWSWEDFKNLYSNLHMDRLYAKTNDELKLSRGVDQETSAEIDKGMVGNYYMLAILDFFKNNQIDLAKQQKLVQELYDFAIEHKHNIELRKKLDEIYNDDDDDKEIRKQMKNLHVTEQNSEAFVHGVLHELHLRLENHDKPHNR